jgi:hypothetical protein
MFDASCPVPRGKFGNKLFHFSYYKLTVSLKIMNLNFTILYYCDIYEGSLDTRQQLSLNNVNKQMLRDNNPNRRRNNEADVRQENRSITMETRVKKDKWEIWSEYQWRLKTRRERTHWWKPENLLDVLRVAISSCIRESVEVIRVLEF